MWEVLIYYKEHIQKWNLTEMVNMCVQLITLRNLKENIYD